jgi:glyoxylase-like metal-dependent hydrolase (beta-lactamase superfamily II)
VSRGALQKFTVAATIFLRLGVEVKAAPLRAALPPTKRLTLWEGKIDDRNATNSTRATEKITDATIKHQKGIRLYRRRLRMASLLDIMVILLCGKFWHCPKRSGFPALSRRGCNDIDGIVGPVGHETGRLKGTSISMNFIPLKLSVTNCFVVKAGDHCVLIDTGFEDEWDLFRRRLNEADVELAQISHIILTHHHDDHCGLVNHILQGNDSIRVVMSQLCTELIRTGENDRLHGGGFLNRRIALLLRLRRLYISLLLKKVIAKGKIFAFFPPYRVRDCDIVVAGDMGLREIGIPLDGTIIETPGHTVDSISILFDDGDCLIGDAASNFLQFLGAKYCVIFMTDIGAYYESWEKVIAAGGRRIFPAHGAPFTADKLKANLWKNRAEDIVPYK